MSRDLRREAIIEAGGQAFRAYQLSNDNFDQAIADHLGMNRTDMRCIDLIDQAGGMTAGELARAAGLTTGAVTAVVDRLERAGMAATDAVYVGDLYSVDVLGARAAGLNAILMDPGACWGARDCPTAPTARAAVQRVLAGL